MSTLYVQKSCSFQQAYTYNRTTYSFGANGLGPALCGWVEMKKGWRWIEWYQMMVAGAITIVLVLFTRETRASVLLSRRAKKLRDDLQDDRYQCRSDAERSSISVLMRVSMTRPLCEAARPDKLTGRS